MRPNEEECIQAICSAAILESIMRAYSADGEPSQEQLMKSRGIALATAIFFTFSLLAPYAPAQTKSSTTPTPAAQQPATQPKTQTTAPPATQPTTQPPA